MSGGLHHDYIMKGKAAKMADEEDGEMKWYYEVVFGVLSGTTRRTKIVFERGLNRTLTMVLWEFYVQVHVCVCRSV